MSGTSGGATLRGGANRGRRKGDSGERRSRPQKPGFAAREVAVAVAAGVLERRRTFDESWSEVCARANALEPRDRAFARLVATTILRRHGELAAVLSAFITKPLPKSAGPLRFILLAAAAQLLMLETPAHAAISLAVDQAHADKNARHFAGLANAVLRRIAREGGARLAGLDGASLNVPGWMMARWRKAHGPAGAKAIAEASLAEAPLDLSVKDGAAAWAERLGGEVLPTGSIRLAAGGRVEDLPGFAEGAWWVQDAAAALPARLLGDVAGLEVADLCAAPGGKTAVLAAAGAHVVSVEQSAERARRITENLQRLSLSADVVVADATSYAPGRLFDAILVDAPCTATGTIRRHPDILHLKRESDIAKLAAVQMRLLDRAALLVKTGGLMVFCTCSLEPEEGETQMAAFLARASGFERLPIAPGESGIAAEWLTPVGDLRTLPTHGVDGFFAARVRRVR